MILTMMTFEKYFQLVSRAPSQKLGVMWKFWRIFIERLFIERFFQGFIQPVLIYCSAVAICR